MCESIKQWLIQNPLSAIEVDCAITVMLKILDGKCKMSLEEKTVMAALYEQIKHCPNQLLTADIHQLIANSRDCLDDNTKLFIYEQRLLAETMISRPVMKAFKAMIRERGLFEC
ncbi:MAG: hypothetical protein WAX77_04870 [Methylococcaceae bacterium]